MDTLAIPAGTVVQIYGMPVRLLIPVQVEGRKENFDTKFVSGPGWAHYKIEGPLPGGSASLPERS